MDGPRFADTYYAQLVDVFAQQGLVPTYPVERVRHLIRALEPSGQLLLLRVVGPAGQDLASVIAVGRNQTAVLWGAASFRAAGLHPNELLHWEAVRRWRSAGALRYDMGGGGDYKAKYGGVETQTTHFYRSRWPILGVGRSVGRSSLRRIVRARQMVAARRRLVAPHRHGVVDE